MKKNVQIAESEYEVMKIIWEKGEARSSEIIERLTKTTDWKPKTIQTLITRLANKEIIKGEKGEGKGFTYYACIKESEYKRSAGKSFLQKVYNGSIKLMMMNFIKEEALSKEDIKELRALLDEKEGENE